MAANATLNIYGFIAGTATGQKQIGPMQVSSATANDSNQETVLANGDNTITVPTQPVTSGVLIVLNSANTQQTKLKMVGGDTGFPLGTTGTHLLNWGSGNAPATFILNSAAAQTGLATALQYF